MIFATLGDSAVVATLGGAGSESTLTRVRLLAAALEAARIPGIVDVVPAYASVAVFYDLAGLPGRPSLPYDHVCGEIAACALAAGVEGRRLPRASLDRLMTVPVRYGGSEGPDLDSVAAHGRLSEAEVIALHSGGEYRVQAIGFAPGFPYLAGLPEPLRTPRRATPRTAVPAGSVGIGGAQSGIYPLETPGGWNLIGRTPQPLFRPGEKSPAWLRVGDRVKFRPIGPEEFQRLEAEHREAVPPEDAPTSPDGKAAIEVIRPGLLTTVQDLGRRGHRSSGLPAGGAMDALALRVANLLVGNPAGAAALEVTLIGPELAFAADTLVAVGGAEFDGVPAWRPRRVAAGDRIAFGECRRGCRAYVAVAGGIDLAPVLGSRSTYLRAEIGGYQGRALRAGDRIPVGMAGRTLADAGAWRVAPEILPAYAPAVTLRVLRGAQAGEFAIGLWGAEYRVTPQSDRMGLRLAGNPLARAGNEELLSSAVAPGTVQVPPDGQPIVLMADAQTIGGYPQVAHVIGPDLPLAAQLRAGDRVRFQEVSLEEAHRLAFARERDLAMLAAGLAARFS